ncbi:hypothetical protein RKE25_08700 [Dyella sp. BiH032]|uniref:hypothetical protein n=1 Tax=Dyella sp. BiH032 TaxID=3075430 RepID=UPI002892F6FE|nr:hypothetical protein [Dyella sp. BiH032]WNL47699.1 hypothetical protein RKE25_08700 [Dyella sp. BiH032]
MLSLLLASCAYRQEATGSSVVQSGETAAPDTIEEASIDAVRERASPPVAAIHSDDVPQKRLVEMSVSSTAPHRAAPTLPEAWAGGTADELRAFPAPDVAMTLESDRSATTSSPVPAPAAMLLDIDQESTRHWLQLTPWYALPVVLALGMPLLGVMGRRGPRRNGAERREPVVTRDTNPERMPARVATDDDAIAIPMGIGNMSQRPWSSAPDPLSREDWSVGLVVRYAPLDEVQPIFATKTLYEVHVEECIHAENRESTHAETLAGARAESSGHGASHVESMAPVQPAVSMGGAALFAGPPVCQPSISEEDLSTTDVSFGAPEALEERGVSNPAGESSMPSMERVAAILAKVVPEGQVFLDGQDGLPVMAFTGEASLPASVLAELESALLETRDPDGTQITWLLTQVLTLRIAHVDLREVDALHQATTTLILHGSERATDETQEHWRARLIELDLARAARQSGASRVLALRNMARSHAAILEAGDGAVLKAWIRVLLHWAQHQLGDSALARVNEAAALAECLRNASGMADEGQLMLGDVLLRRARLEHGGVRARTLVEAQALLDELFVRAPTGRVALAVAEAALERGRHAQPPAARDAFSHALVHAFLAGSDTRWHAASLRLRLSIQLAYESLPGMPVQGNVALDLVHKLDRLPAPPGDAIEGMAQTFVRHGEYGRACRLCAEAWHAGVQAPTLLEAWRQASVQWAQNLTSPNSSSDWRENERQRRVATQMQ